MKCRRCAARVERQYVGLFDKLGLSLLDRSRQTIKPVPTPEDPQAVCAPVAGRVMALDEVQDPAFAQGMLGVGVGIAPEGDVAYAPVDGTVVADIRTGHALLIRARSGAEVLLHVGLDSVALRGEGFDQLVHKGDEVRAGQPVLGFDRSLMSARGLDDTVVVTVTNSDDFASVAVASCGGEVRAGSAVLRCVS